MVQQKKWLSVLCQTRWSNGNLLVAQFKEEDNEGKVVMLHKLFRFECAQVVAKVNANRSVPESKAKNDEIEELLAQQRAAKRLKLQKTLDGAEL